MRQECYVLSKELWMPTKKEDVDVQYNLVSVLPL